MAVPPLEDAEAEAKAYATAVDFPPFLDNKLRFAETTEEPARARMIASTNFILTKKLLQEKNKKNKAI